MTDRIPAPKRCHPWLRLSLRTIFVLLTAACLLLSWKVRPALHQREAVEAIQFLDGKVAYGNSPYPAWLRHLVGIDFLADVEHVSCQKISDLTPLANLTRLRHLDVSGAPVRDLAPLASLMHVQRMDLSLTQVSNVTALATLANLSWIDLTGTMVREEDVDSLRRALPDCTICCASKAKYGPVWRNRPEDERHDRPDSQAVGQPSGDNSRLR